jgi:hypothetical protein
MWQGCKRQSDRKLVSGWSKVAYLAEVVAARSPPPALHPLLLQPSCCFSTCASHRHRHSFFLPSSLLALSNEPQNANPRQKLVPIKSPIRLIIIAEEM